MKGKGNSDEGSDESFKRGESIKIERFSESTVTDKKHERSIPLDRSEIVKKTEQCIEITTLAGEKFELSTEGKTAFYYQLLEKC